MIYAHFAYYCELVPVVGAAAGDTTVISVQSQVAVVHCMKEFVKLHNEDACMSWTTAAIDVILKWMLNGVDDMQLQQVGYALHTNRKTMSYLCLTFLRILKCQQIVKVKKFNSDDKGSSECNHIALLPSC